MIEPGSLLRQRDDRRLFGYSTLHVEGPKDDRLAWPHSPAIAPLREAPAIVIATVGGYAMVVLRNRVWWVETAALT